MKLDEITTKMAEFITLSGLNQGPQPLVFKKVKKNKINIKPKKLDSYL
jgi:hypothetical protein